MFSSLFISIFFWCFSKNNFVRDHYNEGSVQQGFLWEHKEKLFYRERSSQTGREAFRDTDMAVHQRSASGPGLSASLMPSETRAHVLSCSCSPLALGACFPAGAPTCSLAAHSSMVGFPHAREVSSLLLFSVAKWAPNPWRAAVLAWED